MTRRIGAVLGILLIVGLLLVLVWGVYQHHQAMHRPDEALVALDGLRASAVVNFARTVC